MVVLAHRSNKELIVIRIENVFEVEGKALFPVVELVKVRKVYQLGKTDLVALKDVSLKIERGELVAVLGPSGSGKSTLLNLIGGLDRPTEGLIYVGPKNMKELNESELARFRAENIGFVFQFFNLIPTFSTLENVMAPAEILKLGHEEAKRRAENVLGRVGLGARLHHFPHQLSGGEQQRVAIARALVNSPGLLLCDEPTGNLDTRTGAEIVELLKDANERRGITMIVVTHDERMAESANRIMELVDGRIIGEH